MVDGCTPGVAFRKVILPLAAPGVFTTAIIVFIGAWNEFLLALTFLQDKNMQTATVAISKFTGSTGFDTPYGTIMAAGVVVTVPLLHCGAASSSAALSPASPRAASSSGFQPHQLNRSGAIAHAAIAPDLSLELIGKCAANGLSEIWPRVCRAGLS